MNALQEGGSRTKKMDNSKNTKTKDREAAKTGRKKVMKTSKKSDKPDRENTGPRQHTKKSSRIPDSVPWARIPVTVQVGKEGLNDGITRELTKQLRSRGRVKVKLLRSYVYSASKEEAKRIIQEKTGAQCEKMVGFTLFLRKSDTR